MEPEKRCSRNTTMANVFVATVYLAAVLIATAYVITRRRRGCSELPPGWSGWPLIGETLSFLKPCPATAVGDFTEIRMSRFGKVFSSNLLGDRAVASADPDLNRFVLQNKMKLFESYWPQPFRKLFGDSKNIGMHTSDNIHKQFRSIVVGTFITTARLQTSFLPEANRAAEQLVASWKDGSVVSVVNTAKKFIFDVIVKNALGLEPGEAKTEKLREELMMFHDGIFAIPVNFPGSRYNKALKAKENIVSIILQVLEERRRIGEDAERNDFIGWLIKNSRLSDEQICEFILGLIFAGEDTTSRAIPLAIYFLESCPKAIQQLREEHLQVIGSDHEGRAKKLTWEGYKQMEFTQCVFNETLRLGNIGKYIIKKATTDVKYKGYQIPCGCKVIINLSAVHLDTSLFKDPQVFNSWRWLSADGMMKTNNFMPFGGGPRHCPGAEVARLLTAIFLHHLLLNYNWELAERDEPVAAPLAQFHKGSHITIRSLSAPAEK